MEFLKDRYAQSVSSAADRQRRYVNQLPDVEEIELHSESDASDYEAEGQEIGLENEIIERLRLNVHDQDNIKTFDMRGNLS